MMEIGIGECLIFYFPKNRVESFNSVLLPREGKGKINGFGLRVTMENLVLSKLIIPFWVLANQ